MKLVKILSALLAAILLISSANVVMKPAYAADAEEEMTFDGKYSLDRLAVAVGLFDIEDDYEVQDLLELRILSALGMRDIYDVTIRDLQRATSLNLSGIGLTDVPECINYMTRLRTLNLSNNRLQNDALSKLTLTGCTALTSINLSRNFLDRVPGWFVNERVTSKNIDNNFIENENPRSIKITTDTTYYLMNGDKVNADDLKNRILRTVRLNDNSLLPDFLFDYDKNAYSDGKVVVETNQLDFVDWDSKLGSYLIKDTSSGAASEDKIVKVDKDKDAIVDVTIRLFKNSTGDNTKVTIRFYLMDGTSVSSVKQRLKKLIDDCTALNSEKANYTEDSWNNLDVALQTATAIWKYSGSDATMLTNAMNSLNNAKTALTPSAASVKSTIDELIKIGSSSNYKQANYTPDSWANFTAALNKLKSLQNDKNATVSDAQSAIRAFQTAQSNLKKAALSVPAKVSKSDFEAFYGENIVNNYSGTTLEGTKYTWSFNGMDIRNPAEFNPEVKVTDAAEESILLEAGSASKYRLFSTAQTAAFPGKATLEIDVADYDDGIYYLYKWNTAAKRSAMVGPITVKNKKASFELEEGGVYYISPNIRNFTLNSSRYSINHATKTVVIPLVGSVSVSMFRGSMDYGSFVEIADVNGDAVSNVSLLYPGMTVNAPDGDKYTFKTSGDLNNDGKVDFKDVAELINLYLENGSSVYADINGDGSFNFSDVTLLIEYFLNH